MNINQETRMCMACMKAKAVHNHHYILRRKLSDTEIDSDKFTIPLCFDCHNEFHTNSKKGGYYFYVNHNLINYLKHKCGNDPRFEQTLNALKFGVSNEKK